MRAAAFIIHTLTCLMMMNRQRTTQHIQHSTAVQRLIPCLSHSSQSYMGLMVGALAMQPNPQQAHPHINVLSLSPDPFTEGCNRVKLNHLLSCCDNMRAEIAHLRSIELVGTLRFCRQLLTPLITVCWLLRRNHAHTTHTSTGPAAGSSHASVLKPASDPRASLAPGAGECVAHPSISVLLSRAV